MGDTPFERGPPPHKGGSDRSSSKGEGVFEDDRIIDTAEYREKFSLVLKYKPFLEIMIQRLEKATDKARESQLIKMQSLYDILFNPTKQLQLGTIVRCDKVLKTLYEKIEKTSILLPEESNEIEKKSCTITKSVEEQTTSALIENHQNEVIKNDTMTDLEKESDMMTYSNLNNDFQSINVNDVTNSQKIVDFSPSKVNEESRRKLCNIIKKQREEEFESSAINNKNEQKTSGVSASSPVDLNVSTPSNNVRPSEIDNNQLNVTHSDTEPVLQPNFDALKIVENSTPVNFVSPSDGEPFSSTAVDDYTFESLDIDDRKRYFSWQQQNTVKFDQSEKMRANLSTNKTKILPIPQECSPLSTNLQRHDTAEINQNIHTSQIQDNSYKSPTEYNGLNNLETPPGNSYKPPSEKESTDFISPKNNTNSESSKPPASENRLQSLREKLTEEISAVHKVGTSCGGALRSLIHRDDKSIAPNRMANLKAGTIMDLMGKDKPPTRISLVKPKSNFGKAHDERSKLHNIPLSHPHPTPLALNDNNNTNVFPQLGFENSNTLTALTKMNPKELERIVNDHILKLPNSSETVNSNLIKEGDFPTNHPNSESDRNIVHPNVTNVRTNNILSSSTASLSDPRNGIHNLGTSLNIPRYEASMQNYPITSGFPTNASPFSQPFNPQPPSTNISQKFVYSEGIQSNRPLGYKNNIEPEDHLLTTGVYKNPGMKIPDNTCNRNQQSSSFVNYNNPSSEHWKLEQNQENAYSRNPTTTHYHHSVQQPDRFKWVPRPSTSTDPTSGYNVHNRNSINHPNNSNKNLTTTKESRISDSEHRNRSVSSQRPISARDPRRRSVEDPNRSKSNDRNFCKTEQPRNSRNTDPRLSRNSKRGNRHDYISNRDPRMSDSSSSTMYRRNRFHEKNNTSSENDFKLKGTFSSPLDKLYTATSELKTGKGYGPQKFKIPKLKTSQNSDIFDKNKNDLSGKNKSKEIKIIDEHRHNKNKESKYSPKKTVLSVPDGQNSANLKKDSLSVDNRRDEKIKEDNDSDDEIKPPKNSKPKRNLWDESIESTGSNDISLYEKEVGTKRERKKEDNKPKDKNERAKVKTSIKKLVDEQKSKKNIEDSVEVEISRSGETELENKIGDLSTNDNFLKVPTNSDNIEIISQSKDLSTNISVNPASNKKSSPESKLKDEDMRNMFPSSLWDLLASEEKMKFFSKLGENLNAEKLKRIKQIIESNSDDEEEAKKISPPPAQIEVFSNSADIVDTKIPPFSNQIFEDCEKQYENPVCNDIQITSNEDLTPAKNLDEKMNEEKSLESNTNDTINCKSVIREGHKSVEAIDENVEDEERGVVESDLHCENSIPAKKGRAKKKNTRKRKIPPASESVDDQNVIETKKPKKKQKNELEKLQEDIRDMFISKGVVAATGMRLCRLRKAIDAVGLVNDPNKEPVLRESKSCSKILKKKKTILSDDSDISEEEEILCKKRIITSCRSSGKNLISSKKFSKEDNDVPSTSFIQNQNFNKIDTNSKEKSIKTGTDLLSNEAISSAIVIIEKTDLTKFEKKSPLFETDVPHGNKPSKIVAKKNNIKRKHSEMLTKEANETFIENNISSVKEDSADPKAQKNWAIKVQRKYKIKKPKKSMTELVNKSNMEDQKSEINLEVVFDDINYYQENENFIYKCKICAYQGKMIVRHYVGTHPGIEVQISRISPDSAKQAIEESNIMKLDEIHQNNTVSSKRKKKFFNCRMCSRSFANSVIFFDHVSFHTGEYRYECHICKTRVSSKSGLKSHLSSSHYGGKKVGLQIKGTVYRDPPNSDILLGYLCSECNFVQLISTNMDKHLTTNHNENTLSKLTKAIKINLSKPTSSDQEISDLSLIHETKDNIVLLPEMETKIESIDELNESLSEIKIEHPSEINIIDVMDMHEEFQLDSNIAHVIESNIDDASVGHIEDQEGPFIDDASVRHIEDQEGPFIDDASVRHIEDQEGPSNPPKEVDLNVFLGYENITIEDDELNMERERIMNDIVIKLKTQTKPQKDSVLDQIQTKLNKTDIDDDAMKNKDTINETSSPRSRSYLTKEKLGDLVNNYSPEEIDLPVRRTLPERSCKEKGQIGLYTNGKQCTNIEDDSDSSMGEFELELKKYVEELRMSTPDHSDVEDDLNNDFINAIEIASSKVPAIKNNPMSSTIIRLQDTLNRPESVYNTSENESLVIDDDVVQCEGNEIILLPALLLQTTCDEMDNYIANFGSHVVHIDKLPLNVGPLEVYNSNGCVTYRCHFNCDFTSTSIVAFGEHIKAHPRYSCAWNGRCLECNIIYCKEDGKPTLHALTTAFSHLMAYHLFQQKTHVAVMNNVMKVVPQHEIPPPPPSIPLSEYYKSVGQSSEPPKPKGPLLRVRRLSGDMLSAPAVENSLAPNNNFQNQEVFSNALEISDITDLICYENNENNVLETNLTETPEDEMCNFLRIESVVSLNPENGCNFSQPLIEGEFNATISLSDSLRSYISLPQQSPVQQSVPIITLDSSPETEYITSIPMDVGAIVNYATTSNNMDVISTPEMTSPVSIHQLNQISPTTKRNLNFKTVGSNAKTTETRVKFSDLKRTVIDYKSISAYDEMLVPKKLRHFYKCMGQVCTFSCASMEKFAVHYEQHRSQPIQEDPERAWRVCPYCYKSFDCARDYCIHMKKEHGYSNMQCAFCFYRSATLGNVLYHQNTCHITMKMQVLECESQGLEPLPHRDIQFDNHIKPYVCGQGKCNMISFIPENFRRHLQTVHSQLNMFRCHICVGFTASLDRLIEHYTTHGIGMFQCLFCVHGTSFENEMREHLCYTHSNNQPSAVTRVDINTKNSDKTSNKQPLERLKRINFKELEEKIHTVVPFPPGENDEVVCNTSNRNASEVDSITLPEINIDDEIQIIDTIKKADKIIEVICLDSSDEDECLETSTLKRNRSPMDKVLPCNKKSKISSPIFYPSTPNNKGKGSPTPNISDDSQSILESSSSCDKSPAIKKLKENSIEEFNINQPSLFQNDDGQQIIKTIPNVMVVKESSPDTHIKPTTVSDTNPKSGLAGIELFRCGNTGCDHGVQDALLLKEHHATCGYARNSQMLTCVHCDKLFKNSSSYIEHIRIHGTLRYRCSLCEFKAPLPLRVGAHMKQIHRICNTKFEPMNPREIDQDVDHFVCIPKVNSKGGKANAKKNNGTKSTTPSKFSLTDIDKIPLPSIFASALGCSSCTYETKVRSNLVQHLTLHAAGHSVPQEEIVNPVPCLDKHEKMFDKMMNLASSSHTNSDKGMFQEVMKEEKNQYDYPVYIPSNQRYVCHAEGCTYVTIDDTMLRYHIRTLHNEETTYRCPHCPSTDPLRIMPIDRLSTHLKMHDVKLYSCSACSYYHFSRYVVERHVNDKHPKIIASSKTIRENGVPQSNKGLHTEEVSKCHDVGATENLPLQPEGSVNQNNLGKKMWHCNLCKFRSGEEKSMRLHSRFTHRMSNQYKCRLCVYESDVFTNFEDHFSKFHPNLPTQIITSFNKVVGMPSTSSVDSGSTKPQELKTYWRRNSNTVKHIRGILLDEETSVAKTSSAVPIAKAATAVSMIKTPATAVHNAKTPAFTKTVTATTVSIPKEDSEPEFVPPLTDKYGPYGEPTSGNLYQCPLCKQTYKYRRDLKDHMSRDMSYTPWLCTYCCKTYINKTLVTKHIKVVHAPDTEIDLIRTYQPDKEIEAWMNNVFSVQQSLMKNLVVREACRKKVQKKGIISVKTTTQKKLVQDDDRKGRPSTNTEKITKEDDNQELVMKEKKSHTKGKLKFMCGYCSYGSFFRNTLCSHQLKYHPDRPLLIFNSDSTPEVMKRKSYNVKSNNCNLSIGSDDCPLMEEDEEKMEDEETHQKPYYSCYYCKWSSQSISNVKDHWKSLHKEPTYMLNNVQKPGTGVCFLFMKSKCSSESVYSCEWCDKKGSLEFLKQHSLVHVASRLKLNQTHSKKYKCTKCDLMLSSVDVLHRHFALEHKQMELSHNVVETPNETSIIDVEEDCKDYIKSFKCPRCSFASQTHQNVIEHLERHFMSFYCGVCKHQYLNYNSLRNHMILKHPNSSVEPNIVQYSDIEIEKMKKAIIVVEESCDKEILSAEFKVPKVVTKTYGKKYSASVTCTKSTTKRKKNDVSNNLLKLNPKSKPNTKLSLKSKNTKVKMYNINSTDILKNSKTHNRPELQLLNEVNTITLKSHGKTVKMSLLDFTTIFEIIYPKVLIEQSLIVQA